MFRIADPISRRNGVRNIFLIMVLVSLVGPFSGRGVAEAQGNCPYPYDLCETTLLRSTNVQLKEEGGNVRGYKRIQFPSQANGVVNTTLDVNSADLLSYQLGGSKIRIKNLATGLLVPPGSVEYCSNRISCDRKENHFDLTENAEYEAELEVDYGVLVLLVKDFRLSAAVGGITLDSANVDLQEENGEVRGTARVQFTPQSDGEVDWSLNARGPDNIPDWINSISPLLKYWLLDLLSFLNIAEENLPYQLGGSKLLIRNISTGDLALQPQEFCSARVPTPLDPCNGKSGRVFLSKGITYQVEIQVDYGVLIYPIRDHKLTATVSKMVEVDPADETCANPFLIAPLPSSGSYTGGLEFSGDLDWQRFKSPVKGTMVLTLDVPPDKDYQLEVRNDACSAVWVLSQNGPGVDEQFIMPVDPVFYRIHVYGKTSADWGVPYSVSTLWDLDDNQWEKAVPFEAPYQGNLEYGGDEDWQRVQISHENSLLVLAVPEEKDYQLELWRNDTKAQIGISTNSSGLDEQIKIPQPGTYRVHVFGADPLSDFNAPYQVQIYSDEIAPASTVALAGNLGTNDWYRSNVEVSLTATDNPGGSGVQKIEYGFNTTPWNPFTGPWNVYAGPFTISAEGHTHLVYRATDHAGNIEPVQTKLIMIDKTPPTVSPHPIPPSNANGWYNTNVEVGFEASDFQSGIASLTPMNYTFTSEGVYQSVTGTAVDNAGNSATFTIGNINIDKTPPVITLITPQATDYLHSEAFDLIWSTNDTLSGIETAFATLDSQAVSSGQTIDLFFLSLGQHSVALEAMDRAGNSAGMSVTFNVTADISSLRAVTQHAYDLGWIEKQGTYNSLDAKLRATQQNIERNQLDHAKKQLLLFIEKLDSQKGKTINQQAYDLLKADALYVVAHLQ